MSLRKNDVIDYFDDRRICCALILDVDNARLRILSEQGKETKISASRVLVSGTDAGFPVSGARNEQVDRLKELSHRREELKGDIELGELWEVVGAETGEIGVEDLSDLFFGKKKDFNSAAALLRAISADRIYFKIRPDNIEVAKAERVEQALIQREREKERRDFMIEAAGFLSRLKTMTDVSADMAPAGFVTLLEEAALFGKDWTTIKKVKDVFSQPGVPADLDPFRVLVTLGVWSEDENIRLRAEKVPVEFSPEVETEALQTALKPLPGSTTDLTHEQAVAIDSVFTRDVDDALSLSYDGDDAIVGIHITDAAHYVEHGSDLDLATRERGTSIYLPDLVIPMMPASLSEKAASLAVGELRPAISVLARFGPDLKLKDFSICPSTIRVWERLSYEQADGRISDPMSKEAAMFRIACAARQSRVAAGAIIFKDPELLVRVSEDKTIEVSLRDRESSSQILVSEMMILANSLFAKFLKEQDIPGIFRSQPPPVEKVDLGDLYDPVLSYRGRRALARGDIGLNPAAHATLGLEAYTTATSPLRRYPDLLIQRQLKCFFHGGGPMLDRSQLEKILVEISYPLERAAILERERQRYFLLKYITRRKGEAFEAIVLHRFPKFHLVQIQEFAISGALFTQDGCLLSAYDRVLVKIEKINPTEDRLNLSLVRLL